MRADNKSRKSASRLLVIGILLVALVVPAGITFAYFTDYEDAHGGAVIQLSGETQLHEDPKDDSKTVSIENTGETDVIVRLAIEGDFMKSVTPDVPEDWKTAKDDNGVNWWYYTKILKPGETTSEIVALINVSEAGESGHDFDIVVVHESERVSYEGVKEGDQFVNKVVKPAGWAYPDITVEASEEVGE